ncbi:MAG: hypothetical protein LQ338_008046, partial [Usnochroma carphineum]
HPAYDAIAAAGCGPDLKCICLSEKFFAAIQGVLAMGNCSASEAETAITVTRKICVEAAPSLGHSRGPEFMGAVTVLLVLATIAVVLRFLARNVSRSSYGYDDWLILFALVWEYGLSISQYLAIHWGCGQHMLMLDLWQILKFGKLFFAISCIFLVACTALKFSILFFYHRIFTVRKFTVWCVIIGIVIIAWFIAFLVSQFLTCRPLQCFWDRSGPDCKCINGSHIGFYVTSPPDILTNVAILVLPIPWLWGLQMQTRRKVAITMIFLLGSFSVLGSILRIPFLAQLDYNDLPYTIVNSAIWINVEVAIGIVSASLPIMRPLVSRAFPSQIRSRFTRSRNAGSQHLHDNHANGSRSRALDNSGVYAGGGSKKHKTWYNNVSTGKATKTDDGESGQGSEEDMVPMGKIQVRHDVEWEQEETQSAPAIGGAQ